MPKRSGGGSWGSCQGGGALGCLSEEEASLQQAAAEPVGLKLAGANAFPRGTCWKTVSWGSSTGGFAVGR